MLLFSRIRGKKMADRSLALSRVMSPAIVISVPLSSRRRSTFCISMFCLVSLIETANRRLHLVIALDFKSRIVFS